MYCIYCIFISAFTTDAYAAATTTATFTTTLPVPLSSIQPITNHIHSSATSSNVSNKQSHRSCIHSHNNDNIHAYRATDRLAQAPRMVPRSSGRYGASAVLLRGATTAR